MTNVSTRKFIERFDAYDFDRLPQTVVEQGKHALFDSLGALLAATSDDYPVMSQLRSHAEEVGGSSSRFFGSEQRVDAATAALLNGTLAYYCDIESHHPSANVHAIAVVAPAALAVGEQVEASGAKVLAAIIAGIDVAARVSYALGPAEMYSRGFHPTTVAGTFGSAVAAGRLLGLTDEQFTHAFGLAGTSTSGLLSWVDDPSEQSRPMNIGLASQAGTQAAVLASRGFKGPEDIFGGKYPLGRAFTGKWDETALLNGMGHHYEVGDLFFKRNSCCVFIPAGLDGLQDIMRDEQLMAEDIEAVEVRAPMSAYHVVDGNPLRSHSVQYVLAVGAHQAAVEFADIMTDRRIADGAIRDFSERIRVVGDIEIDQRAPHRQSVGSITTVTTKSGQQYSRDIEFPRGAAQNPLETSELEAKFARLTADVLDDAGRKELKEAVYGIETLTDVRQLTNLLVGRK